MNKNKVFWTFLIIVVALAVFFVALPGLVDKKTFAKGIPVEMEPITIDPTELFRYSVDHLNPMAIDGKDLYYLLGWSFLTTTLEQTNYEIYLVLKSDEAEYYYLPESLEGPDLGEAFPEVHLDSSNSGFKAFIAKKKLKVGRYAFEIIYKNIPDGTTYYTPTNKEIVQTAESFC